MKDISASFLSCYVRGRSHHAFSMWLRCTNTVHPPSPSKHTPIHIYMEDRGTQIKLAGCFPDNMWGFFVQCGKLLSLKVKGLISWHVETVWIMGYIKWQEGQKKGPGGDRELAFRKAVERFKTSIVKMFSQDQIHYKLVKFIFLKWIYHMVYERHLQKPALKKNQWKFKRENIFLMLSSLKKSITWDANIWSGCFVYLGIFNSFHILLFNIPKRGKSLKYSWAEFYMAGICWWTQEFNISFPAELGV